MPSWFTDYLNKIRTPQEPPVKVNPFISSLLNKGKIMPYNPDVAESSLAAQESFSRAEGLKGWLYRNVEKPLEARTQTYRGQQQLRALSTLGSMILPETKPFQEMSTGEKALTLATDIGASIPWSKATLQIAKNVATNTVDKGIETVLSKGLDKWIANQGRLISESSNAQSTLGKLLVGDRTWLVQKATDHYAARLAEKRGLSFARSQAVKDTLADLESLVIPKAPQSVAMAQGGLPINPDEVWARTAIPERVALIKNIPPDEAQTAWLTTRDASLDWNRMAQEKKQVLSSYLLPEKTLETAPATTEPARLESQISRVKQDIAEETNPARQVNLRNELNNLVKKQKPREVTPVVAKPITPKEQLLTRFPVAKVDAWIKAGADETDLKSFVDMPKGLIDLHMSPARMKGLRAVTPQVARMYLKRLQKTLETVDFNHKEVADDAIDFFNKGDIQNAVLASEDALSYIHTAIAGAAKLPTRLHDETALSGVGKEEVQLRKDVEKLMGKLPEPKKEVIPEVVVPTETAGQPPIKPPEPPKTAVATPEFPDLPPEGVNASQLTPEQYKATLGLIRQVLVSPDVESKRAAVMQLRKAVLANKAKNFMIRAEELFAEGKTPEEALKQAKAEALPGKLPDLTKEYFKELTTQITNVAFARFYEVYKDDAWLIIQAVDAWNNYVIPGKTIPNKPGTAGHSALSILQGAFAEQPELIELIAKEEKPLGEVVEGIFHETGREPVLLDQSMTDYLKQLTSVPYGQADIWGKPWTPPSIDDLRTLKQKQLALEKLMAQSDLSQIAELRMVAEREFAHTKMLLDRALDRKELTKDQYDIELNLAKEKLKPYDSPTRYEFPIEEEIKRPSLIPELNQRRIVSILKELGYLPVDIGNFLRANKASADLSYLRQQMPLVFRNPIEFWDAQITTWHSIFSQKAADEAWLKIQHDPLYSMYEKVAESKGKDFLRRQVAPLNDQAAAAEEFGYLTKERLLPRLTEKIPWVRVSNRAFVTFTNQMNWDIFKKYHRWMLNESEKVATGKIKLKPLQSFSVEKNMGDFAGMLSDFTGRAGLGRFRSIASTLNALFFATRYTLGVVLTPRHLVSANPYVRRAAWENLLLYVGILGGLIWGGKQAGWWDVDTNPTSAAYGDIQLFKGRIKVGLFREKAWFVFMNRLADKTSISSESGAKFAVNPIDMVTHFMRGKASSLAGLVLDFAMGTTYLGEKTDIKNLKQWVDRISPMAIQDIYDAWYAEGIKGAALTAPLSIGGLGVQVYGQGWRHDFESYNKIPTDPIEVKAKGMLTRAQYRTKHPDIDAKLFIIGDVSTIETIQAGNYVLKLIMENNIDPFSIPSVVAKVEEIQKRKELGVPDTSITPTDNLVNFLLKKSQESQPVQPQTQQPVPQGTPVPSVIDKYFK